MDARERQTIIAALVMRSGSQLESFFRSHGLGDAYRRADDGWGKEKRVNDALDAAERAGVGDPDTILRDAVRHFGLSREEPAQQQPIKSSTDTDAGLLILARFDRLHPAIRDASADYFKDGYPAAAILEAFKAVEIRVREMSGLARSGRDLMAHAFGVEAPPVAINPGVSESDRNEREGFKLIFMGATQGIRNPKAHDPFTDLDEDRAFEYLALASLLMRRLDDADAPRKQD